MLQSYELSLPKILRVMRLSELKTGEKGVIVKVLGHGGFRKRIVEMGFIKGKTVEVLLNAPLRDPIKYKVLGYEISLRRQEAEMIEVVSEEEAKKLAEETIYHEGLPEDISVKEEDMKRLALGKRRTINVALVGNPNSGKTSLFNLASGAHEHVGNYSGVTVDAKEGYFDFEGYHFRTPVCPPPRPSACTWRDWWRKSWALRKSLISSLSAGISSTCGSCRCRSGRRWWSGTPPTAISSAAVSRSARGRSGTPSAAVPAPVLWTASSAGSGPVWAGVREASAPPVSWSCCPRSWEFPRRS